MAKLTGDEVGRVYREVTKHGVERSIWLSFQSHSAIDAGTEVMEAAYNASQCCPSLFKAVDTRLFLTALLHSSLSEE
ncbi:MAG: hypothetical protein MPL62_13870 [Alphaproteobacteria bacterium]|nr:hypothetical protein [Alphaproteobacteria bacterium]